jgi:hypothetical protein
MIWRSKLWLLYLNAFVIGGVLMGFEMLGSRYLFPYFGGGIATWAGLISTVLVALTIGYFLGGAIIDKFPTARVIAISVALAASYMALIPLAADQAMSSILHGLGYGGTGILAASASLCLIPLSLLGMFSPVAVRLLTNSKEGTGRTAGMVYGVSTLGNVFGTLFTTFTLIPAIGSRNITFLFAAVLSLCTLSLSLASE